MGPEKRPFLQRGQGGVQIAEGSPARNTLENKEAQSPKGRSVKGGSGHTREKNVASLKMEREGGMSGDAKAIRKGN